MGDVQFTLPFNEHRLNALSLNLARQGRGLEQELCRILDQLYKQEVPERERESIEAFIEEERRQEAGEGFAVYHFHDADGDVHFMDQLHNNFYSAAYQYKNMIQESNNILSSDSIAELYYRGHKPVNTKTFLEFCDRIPDDECIAALIEFDMENGTVGICENRENEWQLYKLEDVISAVDRAERESNISLEAKRGIFEEALVGREIDLWAESHTDEETADPSLQL